MMEELKEVWLVQRWFSTLTNIWLVVKPMYDVFLSHEHVYMRAEKSGQRISED